MAITRIIEDAIFKGWATYHKHTCAFGSYHSIKVPKNCYVIILDVSWTPFLNPQDELGSMTWKELFASSEYQLKVDGKTSINYMTFRNEFKWRWFPDAVSLLILGIALPTDLDQPIDPAIYDAYILPEHSAPIQKDVFIVCQDQIKLTVSRNSPEIVSSVFGPLSQKASEKEQPLGIRGLNTLQSLEIQSSLGAPNKYVPPNMDEQQGVTAASFIRENYVQGYDQSNLITDFPDNLSYRSMPFYYNPLVELGYVIIKSSNWDKISNSL